MAHFYARTYSGDKPRVSRVGTKNAGIVATVDASRIGVSVCASHYNNVDRVRVTFDGGTNGDRTADVGISYARDTADTPVFHVEPDLLAHMADESWTMAAEDPRMSAIMRRLLLTKNAAMFGRTPARLLLTAYARAEANGGSVDWSDIDDAVAVAKLEMPGEYEVLLATLRGDTEEG